MPQSNWKNPILISLFLLGIIFLPIKLIRAQNLNSFIFPMIESVDLIVKVQNNFQTKTEIILDASQTNLPALSWPLPQNAYEIQVKDKQGAFISYDIIDQKSNKLIIFTAPQSIISFKTTVTPQKENELWTVFLNLVKEPRVLAKTSHLKIILPEGANLADQKLYLIHNIKERSILSETVNNNIYEAKIILEPYTILSWEGKTNYAFQVPLSNQIIIFFDNFSTYSALAIIILGALAGGIFYFFYSSHSKKSSITEIETIPPTFLENSFLMFKSLKPEALAATLISWGKRGLINFVEKEENKIILGKNKDKPKLNFLEKKLWDFLFKDKIQIDISRIEQEAESKIVIPELIDLEKSVITKLKEEHFIYSVGLGKLDLKTTLLLLSTISLIALGISSWILNTPWFILPPLFLNLIIISIGEKFPEIIFLTNEGKSIRLRWEQFRKKISSAKRDLTLDKILEELPLAVFLNEKEMLLKSTASCPPQPLDFFESYNPMELIEVKIQKIIQSSFILAQYLNHLKKL